MNDNLKAADLLDKAAELIAQPGAWTQMAYARNAEGNPCSPRSRKAVCWCAMGALQRAHRTRTHSTPYDLAENMLNAMTRGAPAWQDNPRRKQGGVVQLLRRAAKKLRS